MSENSLTLHLDADLQEWLESEAKRLDQSTAHIAERAIAAQKASCDSKNQAVEEALANSEKGVFVSAEAVHAWMDSWDTDHELPQPKPDIFLNQP